MHVLAAARRCVFCFLPRSMSGCMAGAMRAARPARAEWRASAKLAHGGLAPAPAHGPAAAARVSAAAAWRRARARIPSEHATRRFNSNMSHSKTSTSQTRNYQRVQTAPRGAPRTASTHDHVRKLRTSTPRTH